MPESDSESDIWEYKPLRKTKKQTEARRCASSGTPNGPERKRGWEKPKGVRCRNGAGPHRASRAPAQGTEVPGQASPGADGGPDEHTGTSPDFCPYCQMPFGVLMGQSPRWHVSECLDEAAHKDECPDGLLCTSTIPNHYRRYSHFLLAHRRAVCGDGVASLENCPDGVASHSSSRPTPSKKTVELATNGTRANALMLLRSPTSEDIRKRKGWSPVVRREQSVSVTDGSTSTLRDSGVFEKPGGTPCSTGSTSQDISFSPISSFPRDLKLLRSGHIAPRKSLFSSKAAGVKAVKEDSLLLETSAVSPEDDLFAEHLIQYEAEQENTKKLTEIPSMGAHRSLVTSLTPDNCIFDGNTGVEGSGQSLGPAVKPQCELSESAAINKALWSSPESQVLERLREHLQSRAEEGTQVWCSQEGPTENHTSKKTKSKATSALKQTDIGVFFGLKPLKEEGDPKLLKKEAEQVKPLKEEGEVQDLQQASAAGRRGGGRRKRKATGSLGDEEATVGAAAVEHADRPRRKRWARPRSNEVDPEQRRRCPFYKKIPGTGFVVDAFQYGHIEGATCYFLSHFHSDHYCGLNKNSTFPIYCNRVTSNLLKTKLRVAEQYVHVLPMNTECLVEGVRVVLMDANHCPGAAMLLFLLPDGQTILHTGDFRADPSMERYPELRACHVQTLYLDTTYCSPEYTFPSQHEVVTFAVNVAFEYVTLNPRTLVVCGTYSVGKEKIFLALAEVLGCKAAVSRDKFRIMGCLESERVRQLTTTDWAASRVHVLSMMQVNFKDLKTHLSRFSSSYDQVLAFKPTGWTFSSQTAGVENIQPEVQENITVYGIPYSEHSSYLELKRFVQWLRPEKVIATVNVGSWASRSAMQRVFSGWRAECGLGQAGPGTR